MRPRELPTTDEEYERALLNTHWSGQVCSLVDAAREARKGAGEAYATGNHDELAKVLRDRAIWLESLADRARAKWNALMKQPPEE